MDWLKQIAPTIFTAIGGPLGGLAYEAISKVLGIGMDDAKKMLEEGKFTADQLAQIKLAEIELKKRAQDLGLNFEQLSVEDRKSAREMQSTTRSKIPAILAVGVTVGFFGILISLMTETVTKSDALLLMLGSLGTAWTAIISFYFGSSNSSQHKDELIYNSTPVK